jgi:hypothetical protein
MSELLDWQKKLDNRERDIFRYKIFSYFEGEKRKYITGYIRRYLNEEQLYRWNYFFRPNMDLVAALDEEDLGKLTKDLEAENSKLNPDSWIAERLSSEQLRRRLALSGVVVAASLIMTFMWLWALALAVIALTLFVILWRARPDSEAKDRAANLSDRIAAIHRFREGIANQIPDNIPTDEKMESILQEALDGLVESERHRLKILDEAPGKYDGPKSDEFGPILRWALETDRKDWLDDALKVRVINNKAKRVDKYKPSVFWVARREGHYVRYDVQVIFVHHGQVTLYQGFYDLIQGEWMGVNRRHIVLANLFMVDDETAEDFDFVQKRVAEIAEVDVEARREGGVGAVQGGQPDANPDLINLKQTTIIRFVGGGADRSVEVRFATSGQRASMIARLRDRREALEVEITGAEAAGEQRSSDADSALIANDTQEPDSIGGLSEKMALRARLDEDEKRLLRTQTIDNVESFIDLILSHTRWAGDQWRSRAPVRSQ